MTLSRRQAHAAARTNSDIRLHGNGYYNDDTGQFFLFTDDGSSSVLSTDPRSPLANQFDSEGNIEGAGGGTFGGGANFYVDDSGNINVRALNQNPGYGTGGPLGDMVNKVIDTAQSDPLVAGMINPALGAAGAASNINQETIEDAAVLGAINPALMPLAPLAPNVADDAAKAITDPVNAAGDAVGDAADSFVEAMTPQFGEGGVFETSPERQQLIDYAMDNILNRGDSFYPDYSPTTQSYIEDLETRGREGNPLVNQAGGVLSGMFNQTNPTDSFYQNVMEGGFDNDPGMGTVDRMLNRVGNSGVDRYTGALESRIGQDPSLSRLDELYSQAGANPALGQLSKFSSGEYLGSNPWLDAMFDKANKGLTRGFEDAMRNTNQSFIGSGMTKSTAYDEAADRNRDALLEAQGDLATGIYGGAYDRGTNQMLGATGALGNLSQGVTGQQRGILGDMSGIFGRDTNLIGDIAGIDLGQFNRDTGTLGTGAGMQSNMFGNQFGRKMSGAQGLGGNFQQGFGNNLGAINAAFPFASDDFTNLGARGQAGGMTDTLNTNRAQEPMLRVGAVNPVVPMPAMTQPTQGGNPWLGALGGVLGGAGMFGTPQYNKAGQMTGTSYNPWGMFGMGALGAMGGM